MTGRYELVEVWFADYLFAEQPLDAALEELAAWGCHLDPLDREEVRLLAVPHVLRALPADAPSAAAERLVDAALAPAALGVLVAA